MVRFGTGKRNSNGESLLNFSVSNDLFAANTAFQHPCRHRTTRVGYIAKPGRSRFSKETVPTFVQIDYILCKRKSKCLLKNARSYEHPRTVLKSDHKLVCAQLDLSKLVLIHKKHKSKVHRYDVIKILTDRNTKHQYQSSLSTELNKLDSSKQPAASLDDLFV